MTTGKHPGEQKDQRRDIRGRLEHGAKKVTWLLPALGHSRHWALGAGLVGAKLLVEKNRDCPTLDSGIACDHFSAEHFHTLISLTPEPEV